MTTLTNRGLGRMGFVVPVSNSNLEPDMVWLCPEGVSVHFARAGGYDLDKIPDSDQMRQFADASLDDVMASICAVRPDVVAYGCTSATLSYGPDYDREFCAKMASMAKVPCVTAAGALVEAINDLALKKVGFGSPYTQILNQEGAQFLTDEGIGVVNIAYVGNDLGNYGQGELTPEEIFDIGVRANHDDAEGIVLSCTDMRAVEVVDELEAMLNKPVITSNQALMHTCAKRLGMKSRIPGQLGARR